MSSYRKELEDMAAVILKKMGCPDSLIPMMAQAMAADKRLAAMILPLPLPPPPPPPGPPTPSLSDLLKQLIGPGEFPELPPIEVKVLPPEDDNPQPKKEDTMSTGSRKDDFSLPDVPEGHYRDADGSLKKLKFSADNVAIERRGKKIILPDGMSFDEAAVWIRRKQQEDAMTVGLEEVIEGYPLDAAHAFSRAMAEIYGWTGMRPTPGFFGSTPPRMIGVQTGPGSEDTVQVPWGTFVIPNVDGTLSTSLVLKNGWPHFSIGGEVKNRDKAECAAIARRARELLKTESLYRGKAFRVEFPDDLDDFSIRNGPEFIDTSKTDPKELIFSKHLQDQIDANIFALIEHTEECRRMGVPLKRGILLEGPFGVGKTLTAHVAAKKCVENGWTFIYLKRTRDLAHAVRFARLYQPAMIFAEDIDRCLEDDSNDGDAIQEILNTIDGVDTKGTEIVVVATTNFLERITQAMLRPGRLDAVISVRPPDAEAAQRLIRLFGRDLVDPDAEFPEAGRLLQGQIPASIREVVERSKLAALAQEGRCDRLTDSHLSVMARGMFEHLELLKGKPEDKRSDIEKAAGVLAGALANGVVFYTKDAAPDQEKDKGIAEGVA